MSRRSVAYPCKRCGGPSPSHHTYCSQACRDEFKHKRTCTECGVEFLSRYRNAMVCGRRCRRIRDTRMATSTPAPRPVFEMNTPDYRAENVEPYDGGLPLWAG